MESLRTRAQIAQRILQKHRLFKDLHLDSSAIYARTSATDRACTNIGTDGKGEGLRMTTAFLFLAGGAVTFLLFAVLGAICDWIDRCEMR